MVCVAWKSDGAVFVAESVEEAVDAMRDASSFTAGLTREEYMARVATQAEGMSGAVVETTSARRFLETLEDAKLITLDRTGE